MICNQENKQVRAKGEKNKRYEQVENIVFSNESSRAMSSLKQKK